jgi:flagellar protein FlaG
MSLSIVEASVRATTSSARALPLDRRQEGDLMLRAEKSLKSELNELVANTGLQFQVDRELDRIVVQIRDLESGELLRQVPSEDALAIARAIARSGRGLIDLEG